VTLPIALTMGDPAGIGGELSLKAWQTARKNIRPFYVIDDADRLRKLSTHCGFGCSIEIIDDPTKAIEVFDRAVPVLDQPLNSDQHFGQPNPDNASCVIESIKRAVSDVTEGRAAGVVTNPINKQALYDGAGFGFPGHTEFLGHLAGTDKTVMMLTAPVLKVVPVTIHVSLRAACDLLSTELIINTAEILDADLKAYFGLAKPRIAVSGLNPHAGEGGAMGTEEIEMIEPAIRAMTDQGIAATGPWPADTMFHPQAREKYDVALCMYHDQALIPLKALDFAKGVNVTLGLPFIRTSPDHGTAYDIAGKGVANPSSLIEALRVAGEMADKRA